MVDRRWYVLPTHLCRFAVRARTRLLGVFLGTRAHSLAQCFVRSLAPCGPDFLVRGPRSITGTSRTPPSRLSVAPSVVAPRARCRSACCASTTPASPSPRLTLGGLALPETSSRRTSYSLVSRSHASILTLCAHRRSPSGFSAHGKLPYRFCELKSPLRCPA